MSQNVTPFLGLHVNSPLATETIDTGAPVNAWETDLNFELIDTAIKTLTEEGVGVRGSLWYEGAGIPGTIPGQLNNDLYLNTTTQDVYQLIAGVWTLITNIKGATGSTGPAGPTPSGTPNKVLATDPSGSSTNPAALRALVSADIPNNAANTSGTAANLSGTPTLPNGTRAATQASLSNDTKLATDAYVDSAVAVEAARATAAEGTLVPKATTVNGHALSSNVIVSASDLTTGTLPHAQLPTLLSGDIPNNAANTSGTAANLSGTPALPNGTTATTQSALSNDTKVATDAYADSAVGVEAARATAAEALKAPIASPTFTGTVTLPAAVHMPSVTVLSPTSPGNLEIDTPDEGFIAIVGKSTTFGDATVSISEGTVELDGTSAGGGIFINGGGGGLNLYTAVDPITFNQDTGLSRTAAKTLAIGSNVQGDASGTLALKSLLGPNLLMQGMTGMKFITSQSTNPASASATVDIYTVPSNKRAIVVGMRNIFNTTASASVVPKWKIGGNYYTLKAGGTGSQASSVNTPLGGMPIMEAGESFSLTYSGSGVGPITTTIYAIEFDNTNFLKTVKLLAPSAGDNTVYTCPLNTRAGTAWAAAPLLGSTQLDTFDFFNGTGNTITDSVHLLPSGALRSNAAITNLALDGSNNLSVTVGVGHLSNFAVNKSCYFNGITNASWTFLNGKSGPITNINTGTGVITVTFVHATVGTTAISAGQCMDAESLVARIVVSTGLEGAPAAVLPISFEAGDALLVNSDAAYAAGAGFLFFATLYECPA